MEPITREQMVAEFGEPGVQNPKIMDLIELDPASDKVVLVMIERRAWGRRSAAVPADRGEDQSLPGLCPGWPSGHPLPAVSGQACPDPAGLRGGASRRCDQVRARRGSCHSRRGTRVRRESDAGDSRGDMNVGTRTTKRMKPSRRRLSMRTFLAVLVALPALGLALLAQGSGAPPATYKSSADDHLGAVERGGERCRRGRGHDQSLRVSRCGAAAAGGEPQYAIVHPFSMEIYYVVDGYGLARDRRDAGSATAAAGGPRHREEHEHQGWRDSQSRQGRCDRACRRARRTGSIRSTAR